MNYYELIRRRRELSEKHLSKEEQEELHRINLLLVADTPMRHCPDIDTLLRWIEPPSS